MSTWRRNPRQRFRSLWQIKVVWKLHSLENWRKGFKFGPIQRHRCCDHTTPSHYQHCPNYGGAS